MVVLNSHNTADFFYIRAHLYIPIPSHPIAFTLGPVTVTPAQYHLVSITLFLFLLKTDAKPDKCSLNSLSLNRRRCKNNLDASIIYAFFFYWSVQNFCRSGFFVLASISWVSNWYLDIKRSGFRNLYGWQKTKERESITSRPLRKL